MLAAETIENGTEAIENDVETIESTIETVNRSHMPEIRARRAAANSTLRPISKKVLMNPEFKVEDRACIAGAVGVSKMSYNCSAWCGATDKEWKDLATGVHMIYKRYVRTAKRTASAGGKMARAPRRRRE